MKNSGRRAQSRSTLKTVAFCCLAAALAVSWLVSGQPQAALGYRHYPKPKRPNYSARCRSACGTLSSTCNTCAARDAKQGKNQCLGTARTAKNDCAGDRGCKNAVKVTLAQCVRSVALQNRNDRNVCRRSTGKCGKCCKGYAGRRGQCSTGSFFSYSRFYGSYKYRGKVHCTKPGDQGSPSGAFLSQVSDVFEHLRAVLPALGFLDPSRG
jgi:hypothetical protein